MMFHTVSNVFALTGAQQHPPLVVGKLLIVWVDSVQKPSTAAGDKGFDKVAGGGAGSSARTSNAGRGGGALSSARGER